MGRQSVFVGERFQMESGLWIEVMRYETGKKIHIRFEQSGYECVVEGKQIRLRNIEDVYTKYPQPGQIFDMNLNGKLEVVEYISSDKVRVKFLATGFETTAEACQLKRGTVKDLLLPRVAGVGFTGVGPHVGYDEGHSASWAYLKWIGMLKRCYTPDNEVVAGIYGDVTVCSDWHNFQVFAEWAKAQVGYGNERWAIEKDLLIKGNKVYSPDACCFLPQELNNQLLKATKVRGKYPIGVSLNTPNGRFVAHLSGNDGVSSHLGMFDTAYDAFLCYKEAKEKRLKTLANKWRDQIDPRAYEALMNYTVEITD